MSALFGLGSSGRTAATQPQRANGVQINASDFGKPIPIVYGRARVPGIVIWYGDFKSKENKQQVGKGGGGSITSFTYSFSFALAFAEGPIAGFRSWWINSAKVTNLPDATALGTVNQAPWAHWGADGLNGPALNYVFTAWAAWLNWNAGNSPSTPQVNAEIDGLLQFNPAGSIYGAEPSAILTDLFGNSAHGSNWPWLGDLTQYRNYCVANSLFLSPVLDTETALSDILSSLFRITNSQPVWSGGTLKPIPASDEAANANGAIYTPNVAPVADLVAGVDFAGPVQIDRKPDGDIYNIVRVEWINAAANYVTSVAEAKDLSHISDHGEQAMETVHAHAITDAATAAKVARTILQNQLFVRNTFTLNDVPVTQIALEPMDVITITDALAGLDREPVRIVSIDESGDLAFRIVAEEFPAGVAQGAAHALEAHAGFSADPGAAPDTTQTPIILRAPAGMTGVAGSPEMWIGVAGIGPNWGGANVWGSFDGISYTHIGQVSPGTRYGTIATALAAGADPDIVNSCKLDLFGPGQLTGGANADADNGTTLVLIGSELAAYSATTLNADGTYTIGGNYLRRGRYGTSIQAHAVGESWLRVDDHFFRWPFGADDVGKTVHVKFQAFNLYGGGTEDLAAVPAYTFVLGESVDVPDTPPVPSNLAVSGIADGVKLTWKNVNPAAVAMTSVEFSTDNATWSELGQAATEFYTHHFTNGATYFYRLRARSKAFVWSGYTASISSTGKTVANGATAGATIGPGGNVGGAVDVNGRAIIDLSQGGHLFKNLDNVGDGATYARAYSRLTAIAVPNSDFELGGSNPLGADSGWMNVLNASPSNVSYETAAPLQGTRSLKISNAGLTTAPVRVRPAATFAVQPGDVLSYSALGRVDTVGTEGIIFVQIFSADGASIANGSLLFFTSTAATVVNGSFVVPANSAFAELIIDFEYGPPFGSFICDQIRLSRAASLDTEIADGATYLRMPGANMDANRRGLVDFSQGGHLFKNLDNVGDGATYGRPLGSVLSGGRIVSLRRPVAGTDISPDDASLKSEVTSHIGGQNVSTISLDSKVVDGATYLRMPGANMDANRRGLVDFSQGGHLNKNADSMVDGVNNLFLGTNKVQNSHVVLGAVSQSIIARQDQGVAINTTVDLTVTTQTITPQNTRPFIIGILFGVATGGSVPTGTIFDITISGGDIETIWGNILVTRTLTNTVANGTVYDSLSLVEIPKPTLGNITVTVKAREDTADGHSRNAFAYISTYQITR